MGFTKGRDRTWERARANARKGRGLGRENPRKVEPPIEQEKIPPLSSVSIREIRGKKKKRGESAAVGGGRGGKESFFRFEALSPCIWA